MAPREPSSSPPPQVPDPDFAARGERLAAEGRAITDDLTARLADALLAVLADPEELAALDARSARDAVDYLVRLGRLGRAEGDALIARAGRG